MKGLGKTLKESRIVEVLRKVNFERYGPFIALLVLFGISAIASPYFLQIRNLTNILRQVSYTGIIALGMTFVIISGGIDLSVGSMTALLGGIAIWVLNGLVQMHGGIHGGTARYLSRRQDIPQGFSDTEHPLAVRMF